MFVIKYYTVPKYLYACFRLSDNLNLLVMKGVTFHIYNWRIIRNCFTVLKLHKTLELQVVCGVSVEVETYSSPWLPTMTDDKQALTSDPQIAKPFLHGKTVTSCIHSHL